MGSTTLSSVGHPIDVPDHARETRRERDFLIDNLPYPIHMHQRRGCMVRSSVAIVGQACKGK